MRIGVLLMILAHLCFTVMVAMVKVARREMDALDVVWWRGVASLPIAFLLAWRYGFRLRRPRLFLVRVGFGFGAMFCGFTAAQQLPLTEMSLIGKLQPILVAVIAPLALGSGERVGSRTWGAITLGFIGCTILLAPGMGSGSWFGLWALAGAALAASAHVTVRGLGRTEDPLTLVFWFQVFISAICAALLFATKGVIVPAPPDGMLLHLVLLGTVAMAGQTLMTWSYKLERAATAAAASYTSLLWALTIDVAVFSLVPGVNAIVGGSLVVASGVFLLWGRSPPPPAVVPTGVGVGR